ncbi:MAG: hypothetical protein HYZ57_01955 [Acidobacteria bacterium]|nr:hypothetical protein [Acidobacteriota bacterium]MBI3278586.1 hypothetical protein [Acidobacteriota bacterium]
MKKVLLVLCGVLGFVALLLYLSLGGTRYRVEVCMEYNGRANCRTASGSTEEQALRTAADNACALLASGMTESMACTSRPPKSVNWRKGK